MNKTRFLTQTGIPFSRRTTLNKIWKNLRRKYPDSGQHRTSGRIMGGSASAENR